jgi:hypothetical protein
MRNRNICDSKINADPRYMHPSYIRVAQVFAMVVLMHRPCAEMVCMRPRMLYELSRLVDASGCEISKRSGGQNICDSEINAESKYIHPSCIWVARVFCHGCGDAQSRSIPSNTIDSIRYNEIKPQTLMHLTVDISQQ